MRRTIYIHAGMHKTGTTSIQATLFRNRRWLRRHDLNYLSIAENHSAPLLTLVGDQPHRWFGNVRNGIDTEEKVRERNARTEPALRRELAANRCSRFVISGEEILSLSPSALEALKGKLAPFADDIRPIVYVREPFGYISSAFQERLRNGRDWDFLVERAAGPNYRRISKLIDVFGRDRVDIRVFDTARLRNGDLFADFFAAVMLDPELSRRIKRVMANESLSHEATLIFAALNKVYPTEPDEQLNGKIDSGIFKILKSIKGRPFRCPRAVLERLAPYLKKDVAWLNATIGEDTFSSELPSDDDIPSGWSDEATQTLAITLNNLAADNRRSLRHLLSGRWSVLDVQGETISRMVSEWAAGRGPV